jgi:hypothetical protein
MFSFLNCACLEGEFAFEPAAQPLRNRFRGAVDRQNDIQFLRHSHEEKVALVIVLWPNFLAGIDDLVTRVTHNASYRVYQRRARKTHRPANSAQEMQFDCTAA